MPTLAPLRATARLPLITLALSLATLGGAASAEEAYPTKPIQLLVPYPAGGPADVMARILADKLGATLK